MAYTDPITWVAGNPLAASELNSYVRDNLRFLHDKGADLVAANTITPTTQFHKVTGNTQINNITVLAAGARIVLLFTGVPLLKNANGGGGQLHLLGGDYQVIANETLTFITDGTDWYIVNVQAPPFLGCLAYHNLDQVTSSTNEIVVALNSEDYDVGGFHDVSSLNSRMTIPVTGTYSLYGFIPWIEGMDSTQYISRFKWSRGASVKYVVWGQGGNTFNQGDMSGGSRNAIQIHHPAFPLQAGDFVELTAYQRSGGNRTIGSRGIGESPDKGVQFAIRRVG